MAMSRAEREALIRRVEAPARRWLKAVASNPEGKAAKKIFDELLERRGRDKQIVDEVDRLTAALAERDVSNPRTEAYVAVGENHGLGQRQVERIYKARNEFEEYEKAVAEACYEKGYVIK